MNKTGVEEEVVATLPGVLRMRTELIIEFQKTNCDLRVPAIHSLSFNPHAQHRNGHHLDTLVFSIGTIGGFIRLVEKWSTQRQHCDHSSQGYKFRELYWFKVCGILVNI